MNAFFAALRQWWYGWTGQPSPYETLSVESDPPKPMHPQVVYIVVEDGLPWNVSFMCPCSCGGEVHLNLLSDERPCWQVLQHWHGLISLQPSVWRTNGCRSHFWFRRGRAYWCENPTAVPRASGGHWTA